MNETVLLILLGSAAGLPIFVGGATASFLQAHKLPLKKSNFNNWVVAFGGGALLSAIAFVLIPKGIESLSPSEASIYFLLGTITFMGIDFILAQKKTSLSQVLSMMMDSIPEALALGASFAHNHNLGFLIALFIGLQILPEGFNSYFELKKMMTKKKILILLLTLAVVDIIAVLCGEFFFQDREKLIGIIMVFSSGGIIYLIFQDIAPLAKARKSIIPATGGSFGFLLGMIGEMSLK
jgi:ZIP family zinc transporter